MMTFFPALRVWMWPFFTGDIQIGMVHRKERLDVEVIRARGLVGKPGNKQTPGTSHYSIQS